jgi:hypothetical protein
MLGLFFGFPWGEAAAKFDYTLSHTDWFKRRSTMPQWLVKWFMDSFHHYQYGLALMYFSTLLAVFDPWRPFLYGFGLGLVLSDLDFFNTFARIRQRLGWYQALMSGAA